MAIIDHRKLIRDKLWALLEAHGPIKTIFKPANRAGTEESWLRSLMTGAPNDFPRIEISSGRATHSGFNETQTFAMERSAFADQQDNYDSNAPLAGDWIIRRRIEYTLRISGKSQDETELDTPENEVQIAIIKGGPKLKLDFVLSWGPSVLDKRKTVTIGSLMRCQVEMTLPVVVEFDGRVLLA